MKTKIILLTLAIGASTWLLTAQNIPGSEHQRPTYRYGVGPGGAQMKPGFHLLPPPVMGRLNLTPDQEEQVAALEAEVKARLEKILTPEQLEQLKQMRPPQGGPGGRGEGRGPGRFGGFGGPRGHGFVPDGPPEE